MLTTTSKLIRIEMTEAEAREFIQALEQDEWNAIAPLDKVYAALAGALGETTAPLADSDRAAKPRTAKAKRARPGTRASKGSVECAICHQQMKPQGLGIHTAKKHPGAAPSAIDARVAK